MDEKILKEERSHLSNTVKVIKDIAVSAKQEAIKINNELSDFKPLDVYDIEKKKDMWTDMNRLQRVGTLDTVFFLISDLTTDLKDFSTPTLTTFLQMKKKRVLSKDFSTTSIRK